MWYFWWGCRGHLILITLGSERVNDFPLAGTKSVVRSAHVQARFSHRPQRGLFFTLNQAFYPLTDTLTPCPRTQCGKRRVPDAKKVFECAFWRSNSSTDMTISHILTLSLPRTFSQPFKKTRMSEVVRIGSIIIFIWVSYEKPSSPYCVVVFYGEATGENWCWSLLRVIG